MTTEREQLGLAAKACGYSVKFLIGKHATNDNLGVFVINHETSNRRSWNPRKSDGDCARVEAQLGIDLISQVDPKLVHRADIKEWIL